MVRVSHLAFVLSALIATPAAAGIGAAAHAPSFSLGPSVPAPARGERPSISYRVESDPAPDGTPRRQGGIIAGVGVAPGATIGIGLFGARSKIRTSVPDPSAATPKGSRKAALGFSLKF